MKKTLKEIAESKGKLLLIESYSIRLSELPGASLKESTKTILTEANDKKTYKAFAILYNVPVTRFTENRNGRVYPRSLWERVYESRVAEGTLCLADHPEDEGSITRICGVWHNFRLSEEDGRADLYLIDNEHGRTIFRTLEAGGQIGMSSVGYGELREDSKTVEDDSYELCRLSDAVIEPSQGVFATYDNIRLVKPQKESLDKSQITKKEIIYKDKPVFMEKTVETTAIATKNVQDKLLESNLKNQVRVLIKESRNALKEKDLGRMASFSRDLKEMIDILPEGMGEEKEKMKDVEGELESCTESLISEKNKSLSDINEKYSSLKIKYEAANTIANSLKEKYKKALKVIENLGGSEINPEKLSILENMQDDISKLLEDRTSMERDLKILIKERNDMLSDLKAFQEDRQVMTKDLKALVEDRQIMSSDIKKLVEDRKFMESDLKIFEEDTALREKDQKHLLEDRKHMSKDITVFKEMVSDMQKDINQFVKDRKVMKEDIKQLVKDRISMKEDMKRLVSERKQLKESLKKLKEDFESPVGKLGDKYEYWGNEMQSIAVPPSDPSMLDKMGYEGAELDSFPESVVKAKTEKKVLKEKKQIAAPTKSYFTETFEKLKSEQAEIQNFYEKEVLDNGGIARIKDKILKASSLVEAVKMVESFRRVDTEAPMKLNEGFSKGNSWTDGFL